MPKADVYGGFANVRIGAITHDFIKREAHARGMSIHRYILESAEQYSGRKIQSKALIPDAPMPKALSSIQQALSAIDRKFEALVAPHGKRSFKADMLALDSWFWRLLGLNPTPDDIEALKAWWDSIEAKQSGQLQLNEDVA